MLLQSSLLRAGRYVTAATAHRRRTEKLARTLCVANQKGGVGKTTTAINLACGLALAGKPTLLVDLDPQCNATTGMGIQPSQRHPLLLDQPLKEVTTATKTPKLTILPGCRSFEDIDAVAEGRERSDHRLQDYLIFAQQSFEFVLIDCPPSLGHLTESALQNSNEILMPIQCEYFAMEGLTQMIQVIKRVMQMPNQRLEFGGILLTMYDHTLELAAEVNEEVREFFGEIVFETVIPRDVAVSEAPSFGRSVIEHAPRARGARAYIELCMELLER